MLKNSNSSLIKMVTKLLILLVIAKAISLIVLNYLPSEGIEPKLTKNYQPKYQRVNFKNMIDNQVKTSTEPKNTPQHVGTSITNMILKGIYSTKKTSYIIIAMRSSSDKTSIISVGEHYQGFKLKSISAYSALFTKNSKEYLLNLEKIKEGSKITKIKKNPYKSRAASKKALSTPEPLRSVARTDIDYYSKNHTKIWDDISVAKIKDGDGFKVNRIKKKSKFAALGLLRGDIILEANNVPLKSYQDALNIYKNISKLKTIQLVVLRNNQEKELIYEID